jgi:transposase
MREEAQKRPNRVAAICEAMQRPTMRFVPIKTEQQQGMLVFHRVRETLVHQKTQLITQLINSLPQSTILRRADKSFSQFFQRLGHLTIPIDVLAPTVIRFRCVSRKCRTDSCASPLVAPEQR